MQVATGKVVAGKVVVDGLTLNESEDPARRAGWEARFRRAGAGRVRENLWGEVPRTRRSTDRGAASK